MFYCDDSDSGTWSQIGIDSAELNSKWSTTGNAGTNPAINFIGTTDAQPFIIKTNNTERMRVLSNGNVGINTNNPTILLHVKAASGVNYVTRFESQTTSNWNQFISTAGIGEYGIWNNRFYFQNVSTSGGIGFYGSNTNRLDLSITTNGNVGVGTATPNAKLDIVTTGSADNLELDSAGSGVTGLRLATDTVIKGYWATPRINAQYFLNATAGDMVFRSESNKIHFGRGSGNSAMTVDGLNVGIGTSTPTSKLHVTGLPIYADNAAALAGGMTAGAFYHNGDGILRVTY